MTTTNAQTEQQIREEIELIERVGFTNVELCFTQTPLVYEAEYAGLSMCADAMTFSFIAQMLCPDNVRCQLNMYKHAGSTKEFSDKVAETARVLLADRKRAEEEDKRALADK
jgi:hypothetical protein